MSTKSVGITDGLSQKTTSTIDIIPRKTGHEVSFLYPKRIIQNQLKES